MTAKAVGLVHEGLVFDRRAKILARWFASLLPKGVSVLDVGCGDGQVAALMQRLRPDVIVRGVDVLPRTQTCIHIEIFDGTHVPFGDGSFDFVLLSDVLHHTADPKAMQEEACRVASQGLLIKDHYVKGVLARWRLRFMDWVGNARFGVALPYNYWNESQWATAWRELGLEPERLVTSLGLYPTPANWVFGAGLHFIALLKLAPPSRVSP